MYVSVGNYTTVWKTVWSEQQQGSKALNQVQDFACWNIYCLICNQQFFKINNLFEHNLFLHGNLEVDLHIHVYIADLVLSLASLLIAHSKYKLKQDSGIKKSYASGGLGVSKMITQKRLWDFNFTLSSWYSWLRHRTMLTTLCWEWRLINEHVCLSESALMNQQLSADFQCTNLESLVLVQVTQCPYFSITSPV